MEIVPLLNISALLTACDAMKTFHQAHSVILHTGKSITGILHTQLKHNAVRLLIIALP